MLFTAKVCFRAEGLEDCTADRLNALIFLSLWKFLGQTDDFISKADPIALKFSTIGQMVFRSRRFWFRGIQNRFRKALYWTIEERLFVKKFFTANALCLTDQANLGFVYQLCLKRKVSFHFCCYLNNFISFRMHINIYSVWRRYFKALI